jgi:hypothetical protein
MAPRASRPVRPLPFRRHGTHAMAAGTPTTDWLRARFPRGAGDLRTCAVTEGGGAQSGPTCGRCVRPFRPAAAASRGMGIRPGAHRRGAGVSVERLPAHACESGRAWRFHVEGHFSCCARRPFHRGVCDRRYRSGLPRGAVCRRTCDGRRRRRVDDSLRVSRRFQAKTGVRTQGPRGQFISRGEFSNGRLPPRLRRRSRQRRPT